MKIHDLELFLVAADPAGCPSPVRCMLVRVTTASGLEGWGEASLGWRADELTARRESLLAVLAGRSVYDIEELHTLEALSPAPLRSAVEMAVWDLLGRVLRQPLCNLLGGFYRRRVPVSVRLAESHVHAHALAQAARELAEQGFHTQTILASGRADNDVAVVKAIREMVGDRIALRLDGLGRFDMETARDLAAELEYDMLQFLLDPLSAPELHAMASLGRQTSVPLAAWAAIRSAADVLTAVRCNAAPYVVLDLEQLGGIVPARACAAVAAAAGVVPLLGRRKSLGIATAAMLHLAAASSALTTADEMPSDQSRHTVLAGSFEMVDGLMSVPEGHGLGITVDRAKLEQWQPSA